jgi:hypothetical protein
MVCPGQGNAVPHAMRDIRSRLAALVGVSDVQDVGERVWRTLHGALGLNRFGLDAI